MIWRNIFWRERKFLTFPHCVIYQILREIDFWDSQKYKIYRFFTFRGSEFWCLWNFALFDGWNLIYRIGKIQSPIKWHKMALSQLLNAPKLISRKIWRKEKILQFPHCESQIILINQILKFKIFISWQHCTFPNTYHILMMMFKNWTLIDIHITSHDNFFVTFYF